MKAAKNYSDAGKKAFGKDPAQIIPVKTAQVDRGQNITHGHVPVSVPMQKGLGPLTGETPQARNAKQNKHGGQ